MGAALAGIGVAAPGAVFVEVEAAGRPDVEVCPASWALVELDPAGHGAVFWLVARLAEIRINNGQIVLVFNFICPPRDFVGFTSKETSLCPQCGQDRDKSTLQFRLSFAGPYGFAFICSPADG